MQGVVIVGRERERVRLVEGVADPGVRTISVRGEAGQGKTSLAMHAARSVHGALIGCGKHADDASGRGLRALGEALRSLLDQGLEQLYDAEIGLASLRDALGASATALAALDRDLFADVVEGAVPPLSAGAAVERLGLAVERMLGWMHGFKAPLILVLDDWGRASPVTQQLYARLAVSEAHAATLIGTERDTEPGRLVVDMVVELPSLTATGLQVVAAQHLNGDEVTAAALVDLAGGVITTPLALRQFLELLMRTGALVRRLGEWTLDRGAAASLLGPDAAAGLVRRCGDAAPDLRRALQAVVVAGDRAAAADVAAVTGLSCEGLTLVAASPEADGLLREVDGDLHVAHDTIRSAILADAPADVRRRLADRWAAHLSARDDLHGAALETALRLRLEGGLEALDGPDATAWIARFVAGSAGARSAGASEQARIYAAAALQIEGCSGGRSFPVACEAAQAALQAGDLEGGATYAGLMHSRARTEEERLLAAESALLCARLSGKAVEGLRLARAAIATQGLRTPERVGVLQAAAAILVLRLTSDRPASTSVRPDSALFRVLNTAGYMAFEQEPRAAVVLSARAATFAPLRGTAYAAGLRATLSCLSGDWNAAIRSGRTALERLERPEPLRAPALHLSMQFGAGLEMDAARTFDWCARLQALAVEEGDLGIAAYANRDRALSSLRRPADLKAHRSTLADCRASAERFEDQATGPLISALDQMAFNLADGGDHPWTLQGAIFDSPRFEREADEETRRIATAFLLLEAMLANAFGAWETTVAVHGRMAGRFDNVRHHPWIAAWSFHTGLARMRMGLPIAPWELASVARHARVNSSLRHRHLALEAERRLRAGRPRQAVAGYEAALQAAEVAGFHLEAGVVATAAASAARTARLEEAAERFDARRRSAWRALGALALLDDSSSVAPGAAPGPTVDDVGRAPSPTDAGRAKMRLLTEAAHELRTPMQGIQGLLDLASHDPAALDLPRIRDAFAGLRAVVDDLTDFGAVEAQHLSITEAAFSPKRLLETEVVLARPEADRRGRVVRLRVSGGAEAEAYGDAGRIAQVVRNLVSNALRYGDGDVTIDLGAEGRGLVIEVADEGPGLSQADLTRLFQPFARGDASVRAEGSGLGLALSRRLAERMGGRLTGANKPVGGAVFRLELPRRPPGAAADAVRASSGPLRLLLAEDVALSRETMTELLRARGHDVVAVADGEAALAAGLAERFDALLLDARMPRLGGCEVLARLRAAGCVTPALVITAAADPELAQRLRDLQPVRLARKPLTADQLQALLGAGDAVGAVRPAPSPAQASAELASRRAALDAALGDGDVVRVREIAHAAAGLAAEFGLTEAETLFGGVEDAAARSDTAAVVRALAGGTSAACGREVDRSKDRTGLVLSGDAE